LLALLSRRIFLVDAFLCDEFLDFPWMTSVNYSAVYDHFGATHMALNSEFFLYTGVQDWLLCDELEDHFKQQFVFMESDMYFAALLRNNPYYELKLTEVFGDLLFSKVAQFLFRPRPEISREVDHFVEENLLGRTSVGIHVRTHTLGHPGYIEPYALMDKGGRFLTSYWKCAQFAAGGSGIPGQEADKMVFLAADNGGVRHAAQHELGGQVVFTEQTIARNSVDGQRAALVDLLVLSRCDFIITTQMSTFSYVAHALTGKTPYIVNFQGACVRDISSEPCMHAWRHVAIRAPCLYGELPITSTVETRNCGYYTQQSLNAPQNCEWEVF